MYSETHNLRGLRETLHWAFWEPACGATKKAARGTVRGSPEWWMKKLPLVLDQISLSNWLHRTRCKYGMFQRGGVSVGREADGTVLADDARAVEHGDDVRTRAGGLWPLRSAFEVYLRVWAVTDTAYNDMRQEKTLKRPSHALIVYTRSHFLSTVLMSRYATTVDDCTVCWKGKQEVCQGYCEWVGCWKMAPFFRPTSFPFLAARRSARDTVMRGVYRWCTLVQLFCVCLFWCPVLACGIWHIFQCIGPFRSFIVIVALASHEQIIFRTKIFFFNFNVYQKQNGDEFYLLYRTWLNVTVMIKRMIELSSFWKPFFFVVVQNWAQLADDANFLCLWIWSPRIDRKLRVDMEIFKNCTTFFWQT